MLESWGKLYTSCTEKVSRQLVAQLTDRFVNEWAKTHKTGRPQNPLEPVTKHNLSGCVKFPSVTPDKLVSFLEPGEKS